MAQQLWAQVTKDVAIYIHASTRESDSLPHVSAGASAFLLSTTVIRIMHVQCSLRQLSTIDPFPRTLILLQSVCLSAVCVQVGGQQNQDLNLHSIPKDLAACESGLN